MKKSWLNGKTALLTGASSGIGKGIAEKLIIEYGCFVIGVARTEEKLRDFQKSIKEFENKFHYYVYDISVKENWNKLLTDIENNNERVDVLINNAGMLPPFKKTESFSIEEIRKVMDVNFFGAVEGCSVFFKHLQGSKTPAIINIASSAALATLPGTSVYSASKSALKSYTEALQTEHKKDMFISFVCPGFTRTNIFCNQKVKTKNSGIINKLSMSCDKMVKKIVKSIHKKRRRNVFGLDAKAMDGLYRLLPKTSLKLFGGVMKISNLDLFKDIFCD